MVTAYLVFVVGAFLAALFLLPLATQNVTALASPCPKADPVRRLIASVIDVGLAIGIYAALSPQNALLAATFSPIYLVVRDGLYGGQSFGKMCFGLVAIQLQSGRPVQLVESVRRNFLFGIPGMNITAIFFEARQIQSDKQGMRLGDRFAGTQVVHGKDAIDLVKAVVDAVRALLSEIRGESQPHRTIKSISMWVISLTAVVLLGTQIGNRLLERDQSHPVGPPDSDVADQVFASLDEYRSASQAHDAGQAG